MINHNNYYYKGYDIENKMRMEQKQMEYLNPYGYNFEANSRKIGNGLAYKTNQNDIYPELSKKKTNN
jgi:hypothetical protein